MTDWVPATLFVVAIFAFLWISGARKYRRALAALAQRRANPTEAEFIAMLDGDCEPDIAKFLWDELAPYWRPNSPHADDDFLQDLPIDHDEPNDWLAGFCAIENLEEKTWPLWSNEQSSTVRNFARWLSEGRQMQQEAINAPRSPAARS